MLQDVGEAVVKVEDWRGVLVEEGYIVLGCGRLCAVDRGELVLGHVSVCGAGRVRNADGCGG